MENLAFGIGMAVLGMGIVFGVLALLWALLTLALRLDARSAQGAAGATIPAGPAAPAAATSVQPAAVSGDPAAPGRVELTGVPDDLDPRLVAAITVAILRHEEARRLQAAPAMRSYWPGSLLFASRWVAAGRTRQGQSWRRRR